MKRCSWCKKPVVQTGQANCNDCKFLFEVGNAAVVIIIVGAALIAIIGR